MPPPVPAIAGAGRGVGNLLLQAGRRAYRDQEKTVVLRSSFLSRLLRLVAINGAILVALWMIAIIEKLLHKYLKWLKT